MVRSEHGGYRAQGAVLAEERGGVLRGPRLLLAPLLDQELHRAEAILHPRNLRLHRLRRHPVTRTITRIVTLTVTLTVTVTVTVTVTITLTVTVKLTVTVTVTVTLTPTSTLSQPCPYLYTYICPNAHITPHCP